MYCNYPLRLTSLTSRKRLRRRSGARGPQPGLRETDGLASEPRQSQRQVCFQEGVRVACAAAAASACPCGFPLPTRAASRASPQPQPQRPAGRGRTRTSAVQLEAHPHSSLQTAESAAQDKARERRGSACSGHRQRPSERLCSPGPHLLQPYVQSCLFTRQFTRLSSGNIRTSPVYLQRK